MKVLILVLLFIAIGCSCPAMHKAEVIGNKQMFIRMVIGIICCMVAMGGIMGGALL